MRIFISQTLDGYIAGPGDDLGHLDSFQGNDYGYDRFVAGVPAVVLGRRTFDRIFPVHGWTYPVNLPGAVMTSRPLPDDAPAHVAAERDPRVVASRYPGAFLDGGAETIRRFMDLDLIREATLFTLPVFLGGGIRLFPEGGRRSPWRLVDHRAFPCGTVMARYEIGGEGAG